MASHADEQERAPGEAPSWLVATQTNDGHRLLSSILRHDAKSNSYKFALLRAINDIVLEYPDVHDAQQPIAIPLHRIAEAWMAYYWPLVAEGDEIAQGPTQRRKNGTVTQDMAFRAQLRDLRSAWEARHGFSAGGDGWLLVGNMRRARTRTTFDRAFKKLYDATRSKVARAVQLPL